MFTRGLRTAASCRGFAAAGLHARPMSATLLRPALRLPPLALNHPPRATAFSYITPKKLKEIAKLPLLERSEPARIEEVWQEFHSKKSSSVSAVLTSTEYATMISCGGESRMFVFPVPQVGGGFFSVLTQWQGPHCLVTYLEEFKKNPETASALLSLTMYDELLSAKQLALVRGDFTAGISKEEAQKLMMMIFRYYLDPEAYRKVYDFNNRPREFDIDTHMRNSQTEFMCLEAKVENNVNLGAEYINDLIRRAKQYQAETGDNLFANEQASFLELGKK